MNNDQELVDVWKVTKPAIRGSADALKWILKLKNPSNSKLLEHVFYNFDPNHFDDFAREVLKSRSGCHFPAAVDGTYVRYIGDVSTAPRNSFGVYKIAIEIYTPKYSFNPADGIVGWDWKKKNIPNGQEQTFFPNGMSKDEIIEQFASALASSTKQVALVVRSVQRTLRT